MASKKLYSVARALQSNSEYAQRMKMLSASIFGEVKRPQTGWQTRRVQKMFARKPYEERKEIVEYWPAHEEINKLMTQLRDYGLYRNEHEDFKEEMDRIRKLKGREKKKPKWWKPPEERKPYQPKK